MATLQRIRNKAGILVAVFIGMALIAFILGDFLGSGQSMLAGDRLEVAEIGGESVNYMDYNAKIEELAEFYRVNYQMASLDQEMTENVQEEVWRQVQRELILGKSFTRLGIHVSSEELKTMLLGESIAAGSDNMVLEEPHPIIQRMFTNPETGEFNRFQLMNYFDAISQDVYRDERKRWMFLENQIVDERLTQKYFTMVTKGMQANSLEINSYALETGSSVDFDFVFLPFTNVTNDKITVTDADLKKYYEEHKQDFKQSEGRNIEYVVFNITPSEEDDRNAQEFVEQSRVAFGRSENPVSFVNSNSDLLYNERPRAYSELNEVYRDSIFRALPGYVTGTYFEDNAYKMARLIEFVNVPDSVRARHILISLSVQRDQDRAKVLADSIKNLIDKGQDFTALAREFSADDSNREIGGDLGWFSEGTMVKPFSDACFYNNKNEVLVVKTTFGYHVVRIEDQSPKVKKARIAELAKQVNPSDETFQKIYADAVAFRADATTLEKFREVCISKNISPRFASDILKDAKTLPGLENSREIIRWTYENEKDDVSQIFDLSNRYVIAAISEVRNEGYAPLESVRTQLEVAVMKEKKMEALAAEMLEKSKGLGSIDEVSVALNAEIKQAQQVRFSNPYVVEVGLEPAVVASAFELQENILSAPVKGENGVFILTTKSKQVPAEPDLASAGFRLKYGLESRVSYEAYEALRKKANIQDNRIKFY
jgi:peptidyl-prolyl cis-trans isomerase D